MFGKILSFSDSEVFRNVGETRFSWCGRGRKAESATGVVCVAFYPCFCETKRLFWLFFCHVAMLFYLF